MAQIDIKSLFSDILPDPAQQQRERVLQQNEAVNQANLVGTLGGMAAYLAPQRSAALSSAATGLLGLDTRSEAEKAMEQLKSANVDLSSREGLIKAANIYQEIDPIKAAQLRAQAAQVKRQEEADARKLVEQQQADTTFAMNQAAGLEELTSRVTTREEVGQQREANATLVDNSEVLTEAEQQNYKALINSGAFDGKQADLLKVTNPAPLVFGNNAVVKDKDGNWTSIVTPASTRKASGLEAIARLTFDENDPKLAAVVQSIQAGEITTMTQLNSLLPEEKERAEIPKQVADVYNDTSSIARSAFIANSRIDSLLKTIEEENLLSYTTGGVFSTVRSATLKALGERDEIEFLRTAYIRERNTEIVNSLPKGTASDRDIAIFSAGFPPEDATIEEVYNYLQAAKNINNLNQEYNDLLGMYINTQAEQGVTPTAVGFDAEFKKYVKASNVLKANVADVQAMEQPSEEDIARIQRSLTVFEDTYGKLPIDLY